MTYINKKLILTILILTSCAYIDYSDIYDYAKISILGAEDIKIDDVFIKESKSSFIKAKLGKTLVATLVLANVEDNIISNLDSSPIILNLVDSICGIIKLFCNLS